MQIILNSTEVRAIMPIVGEAIKGLTINFFALKEPQELLNGIMEFYSNSLISMEWNRAGPGLKLTKSFPNIENLVIENSSLAENLLQFNELFPAMKSLRLIGNYYGEHVDLLKRHFPNLNNLALEVLTWKGGIPYSDFQSILRQNRQIRSLNSSLLLLFQNQYKYLRIHK